MRPYQEFQNAETGEYTKEFQDFYDAIGDAGCANFDCNQVALALKAGLTIAEAVAQFDTDYFDNKRIEDFEDHLNHDMCMNGDSQ